MSIEAKIEELTAALKENTVALRDVLAASASKTAPTEEKPKKAKAKKEPKPEPEPEPAKESEPAAEEEPPAKDEPEETEPPAEDDADTLVAKITEAVRNAITRPGGDPAKTKNDWMAIRQEFGVEKISELTDIDKLKEALAKAEGL